MIRRVRRTALLGSCAVAATAVFAASAQAAGSPPTVTTLAATQVTATTAILNGTISANGSATGWQFQYGATPTTLLLAPTPAGTVGATGANVPVSVLVKNLTPGTTYSFRLLGANATNFSYYYLYGLATAGTTLTFTTAKASHGKVTLGSHNLKVKRGFITFLLKCQSSATCKGKLSLTGHGKLSRRGHSKTFSCVNRKSFSVRAGKTGKIKGRVTGKCKTALRFAKHHKIHGKLNVTFSTGQHKLSTGVSIST